MGKVTTVKKTTNKKIASFEDACAALKIKASLPDVSALPDKHQKALIAHYKLIIIAQALNKGWEPNWSDYNQNKYYPYFWLKKCDDNPSGFAFSGTHYGWTNAYANVGSRLCFKTEKIAEYAAKTFADLYQEYLLIG